MVKIAFLGAGSTVFARNVLGDCMCTPVLRDAEIALYDIDAKRLEESEIILRAINNNVNEGRAQIATYLGVENRKAALKDADFVVNAIQVGGYEPCTVTDFEIPKKYGLLQTIGDTLGIGGIMRGLRTIPVMEDFARDMEEVCPNTLFLNYTNPMAILTGYMQRYTKIRTVGLCHSVQVCTEGLLKGLGMEDRLEGATDFIAGINHMAWLLDVRDKDGNDLYPEIRKRALEKNASEKHNDMIRYEYIRNLGYYCTESSEHNSEYNPFYIKSRYPELIDRYNIPLDEYPRRCIKQIADWEEEKKNILNDGKVTHERSREPITRCFCQSDISWNHRFKNFQIQIVFHIFYYLHGKVCSGIIHGKENSFYLQIWIQSFSHKIYCMDQLTETFQSIVFTLNWYENGICRRHGINSQHI